MASRAKLIGMAIVVAAAIGMSGCKNGELVSWDELGAPARVSPRTGEAVYTYLYYPDSQVYFEPHSHMYYWFEDGAWFEGNKLPGYVAIDREYFEFVHLDTSKPWTHHVTVTSKFGFGSKEQPAALNPINYAMDPSMHSDSYGAPSEVTVVDPDYAD